LIRRGESVDTISDERLGTILAKHLSGVQDWLALQPNISLLIVDYNALVADPQDDAEQVNAFLGGRLDVEAMCAAVNPQLYRNRMVT
jgi:hypothetical protein